MPSINMIAGLCNNISSLLQKPEANAVKNELEDIKKDFENIEISLDSLFSPQWSEMVRRIDGLTNKCPELIEIRKELVDLIDNLNDES